MQLSAMANKLSFDPKSCHFCGQFFCFLQSLCRQFLKNQTIRIQNNLRLCKKISKMIILKQILFRNFAVSPKAFEIVFFCKLFLFVQNIRYIIQQYIKKMFYSIGIKMWLHRCFSYAKIYVMSLIRFGVPNLFTR